MAGKKTASKLKRKSGNGKAAATQKAAAKKTPAKLPSIKEPMSKSTIIRTITDVSTVGKKDVVAVLECLHQLIEGHIKSRGPGIFVLPGLLKITVIKKPARPARKGINPFTGEEIMIKAKPAHKAIKVRALRKLKEMVD